MTKSRIKILQKIALLVCTSALSDFSGSLSWIVSIFINENQLSREVQRADGHLYDCTCTGVHCSPPLAVHPPPYVITETAAQFRRLFHQFDMWTEGRRSEAVMVCYDGPAAPARCWWLYSRVSPVLLATLHTPHHTQVLPPSVSLGYTSPPCWQATPWWRCRTPPPGRTTTKLSSTRENVSHMWPLQTIIVGSGYHLQETTTGNPTTTTRGLLRIIITK